MLSLRNERGVVAIYVGLLIFVFLFIAALAVDIGYMLVGKTELQRTADAAALAATRQLGYIYEGMSYPAQQSYDSTADELVIKAAAINVASQNKTAGASVVLNPEDVEIGTWDQSRSPRFLKGPMSPDAVRVTARKDGTTNAPISTFFARIFGINSVGVTLHAVAALTGESTSGPGGLPIPIGIPTRWFENPNFCGSSINFYPPCNREPCPTAEGCAGYHSYTDSPASASRLKNIMDGIRLGTYNIPSTTAGATEFNFTGGTLANLMNPPDYPFIQLFDTMKVKNDGIMDLDQNPNTWTATVIVYESNTCANPNQSKTIAGYTTIVIEAVTGSPNPTVHGRVLCDFVQEGRGGGSEYGTKGSIPGLVQ